MPTISTDDVVTVDTVILDFDIDDSLIVPGMPLVDRWPLQYEMYYGHLIVLVDSLSPRVAQLTLLSLRDWSKIYSASSDQPTQAADTASSYAERGLMGWTIPAETVARRLKSDINLDTLNSKLAELHADEFCMKDGSSNARYLCEEATKTFSMAENTNITQAGAKTKYHLRLTTTMRVARH